jgi:hypothetical protein
MDFYVRPEHRMGGFALKLLASVANEVASRGGTFLRGVTVENPIARRLFGRSAVCHSTVECTLGGRALRHLASLSQSSAREIARSFPARSWNYER